MYKDEWFPEHLCENGLSRVECTTTQEDEDGSYYVVFYDGHNNGPPNPKAKWLSKRIGVPPRATL